jgi:hypothetical protein
MVGECGKNLFGGKSRFIKTNGGDFIAIEGANTKERLILSDLRIPYKQILKGRVILKPGQKDYLLNHLGLGDNATFLSIKAIYNQKSVIEENNYIVWNYFSDPFRTYTFAQMMTLTGNSTNRIEQIYLTNPNKRHDVVLEMMVAVIDDEYSFFDDYLKQGMVFTDVKYTDIVTHVVDESIAIIGKNLIPMVYINLKDIINMELMGRILIITTNKGKIFIEFESEYHAKQGYSLINWVLGGEGRSIQDLDPRADLIVPVIHFTNIVDLTTSNDYPPYNTTMGDDFVVQLTLDYYGSVNKEYLMSLLIDKIEDDRDGEIQPSSDFIKIYNQFNAEIQEIDSVGVYKIYFVFSDLAGNQVESVENITLTISL